ncbi:MAG: sensor histidine kinase [Phycisphaerales bacterium]
MSSAPLMTLTAGDGEADFTGLIAAFNRSAEELQRTHEVLQSEVGRLRDDLAEARARLRRSEQLAALGEMAAGIAHEIRNPLGSIGLYAQALEEDLVDQPEQSDLAGRIINAVRGLDAIVRDVLAFSRDHQPDPRPTDLAGLSRAALAHCAGLLSETDTHLELVVVEPDGSAVAIDTEETRPDADGSPAVCADAVLMPSAVANLVRNAVEAMASVEDGQRQIRIELRRDQLTLPDGVRDERAVLRVIDRGPGIPADVRARMFNPFFTTRATGTGLGLAIVHRIVDAHGGHVVVDDAPGGGARIDLCLPLAAAGQHNPATGRPATRAALIETTGSLTDRAHDGVTAA